MNNEPSVIEIETRTGQPIPPIADDQAVSFVAHFTSIQRKLKSFKAPRRPNRNRPIHSVEENTTTKIGWATVAQATPSRDKLAKIAARFTPPDSWFEEEDVF